MLAIIFCFAAATTAQSAPGDLDPMWGNGGIVISSLSNSGYFETPDFLHTQPDGKVVVSGDVFANVGIATSFIARFNPNGTLDSAFGINGRITAPFGGGEYLYATALQPDGKIVAAGYKTVDGNRDFVVARYNLNGTLDTTFGTDGKTVTPVGSSVDEIKDLIVQPDGRIVAVGDIAVSGSGLDFAVVRYNSNGTLDTTFGTDGKVITIITNGDDIADRHSAALQPDGNIVVGGSGGVLNKDFVLVRYNSNGTLDSTFGTNGKVITAL